MPRARCLPQTLLLVALSGCGLGKDVVTPPPGGNTPPPPPVPAPGLKVTGPGPFLVSEAIAMTTSPSGEHSASRVYVALRPAALPAEARLIARVQRTGEEVTAEPVDGGFDPLSMEAIEGDTLVFEVQGSQPGVAASSVMLVATVPQRRPPVIVRTVPPRGKRDVALNARMQVVFSEPMAIGALTPGTVVLHTGGEAVPGVARFVDPYQTTLEFVPEEPLLADTDYELVVHPNVRDLGGTPLEGSNAVEFHTVGDEVAPPPSPPPAIPPPPVVPQSPPPPPPLPSAPELGFVRDGQIWLSGPGGEVQLTHTPAGVSNSSPTWSPDGNRLAFVSDRDGEGAIYVMTADGSSVVRRIGGTNPVYTADGLSIIYSGGWSTDGGLTHSAAIMKTTADNMAGPTNLVLDLPGYEAFPAISPDGQRIAFSSDWRFYDGLFDMYVAPVNDPAAFRPLLEGGFFSDFAFFLTKAWSPDGQRIAVSVCNNWAHWCNGEGWLGVVSADGGDAETLVRTDGMANPSWSRDGAWIAYNSWTCLGAAPCIRIMPSRGGPWQELVNNAIQPAWRP